MKCRDCRFWQGSKYSTCADCYRVIGTLIPTLTYCHFHDEERNCDITLELPLDPHYHTYWYIRSPDYRRMIAELKSKPLPEGVHVEKVDKLEYYKTDADYECELGEEK